LNGDGNVPGLLAQFLRLKRGGVIECITDPVLVVKLVVDQSDA
jgi:hypothetical protein